MRITSPERSFAYLQRVNLVYGMVGTALLVQFAEPGAWRSFVAGWAVAIGNLELLRRIGTVLFALFAGQKPGVVFYLLLAVKFSFWGLVIALFTLTNWLEGLPFVLGTCTLLISAAVFGVREWKYARAA